MKNKSCDTCQIIHSCLEGPQAREKQSCYDHKDLKMEGNQYLDKQQYVFIIQHLDTENMALCEYCKHQPASYNM